MTNLFETQDPRGLRVICTKQQWLDHVLGFHEDDMNGCEQEVQSAIEAPMYGIIYQDADNANRCIYYKQKQGIRAYLKVVVDFDEDVGFVVTAYLIPRPKSGERPIWP